MEWPHVLECRDLDIKIVICLVLGIEGFLKSSDLDGLLLDDDFGAQEMAVILQHLFRRVGDGLRPFGRLY